MIQKPIAAATLVTSLFLIGRPILAKDAKCSDPKIGQRQLTECAADAAKDIDKQLNVEYQRALKGLIGVQKDQLIKAQRLWVKFRDEACELERQVGGGCDEKGETCGSMASMIELSCSKRETKLCLESVKNLSILGG